MRSHQLLFLDYVLESSLKRFPSFLVYLFHFSRRRFFTTEGSFTWSISCPEPIPIQANTHVFAQITLELQQKAKTQFVEIRPLDHLESV